MKLVLQSLPNSNAATKLANWKFEQHLPYYCPTMWFVNWFVQVQNQTNFRKKYIYHSSFWQKMTRATQYIISWKNWKSGQHFCTNYHPKWHCWQNAKSKNENCRKTSASVFFILTGNIHTITSKVHAKLKEKLSDSFWDICIKRQKLAKK